MANDVRVKSESVHLKQEAKSEIRRNFKREREREISTKKVYPEICYPECTRKSTSQRRYVATCEHSRGVTFYNFCAQVSRTFPRAKARKGAW